MDPHPIALVLPVVSPIAVEGGIGLVGRIAGEMPGRSPNEVVLSEAERAELEHVAACYTRPHLEVLRAKLVLMAAAGETNTRIGARLTTILRTAP